MSVLTSVEILILAMLIMASLQFVPSVFSLFSHYSHGRFSKNKASDLVTFFIIGVEAATVAFFVAIYCIMSASPVFSFIVDNGIAAWVTAGVIAALGVLFFLVYFQKGRGTAKLRLFPNLTSKYPLRIKSAKSRSDAFLLGFFSVIPELVFTIPLYVLVTVATMRLGADSPERAALAILFAFSAIAPLVIIHIRLVAGHNLADFIRFRLKNKTFFRVMISLLYFLIAGVIIMGVTL